MAFALDHDHSPRAAIRRPDPFASLTAHESRRERSWLSNLLRGPFKDDDERASYRLAGLASDARNRAGMRPGKAWNGNGVPAAEPPTWLESVARPGVANGQPLRGMVPRVIGFSSDDRAIAGR